MTERLNSRIYFIKDEEPSTSQAQRKPRTQAHCGTDTPSELKRLPATDPAELTAADADAEVSL